MNLSLDGAFGWFLLLVNINFFTVFVVLGFISFLFIGVLCLTAGLVISAIDLVWPHRFSTILEACATMLYKFKWKSTKLPIILIYPTGILRYTL